MQLDPDTPALASGDKPMPKFIRRSLIALSIDDPQLAQRALAAGADAVILGFTKRRDVDWRQDLTQRVPAAIHAAGRGGAEVFVRIGRVAPLAELDATVFSGITGVVLTGVTGPRAIADAAERLTELELARGIAPDTLEIDVEADNAACVWHSLEIARASERFGMYIVNEPALCRDLGMQTTPVLDFDPLEYVKSQLITVAMSVGGQAAGMSYPLGLTGEAPTEEALRRAVRRARDTGFKGAFCPQPSWVAACNEGFRPSADEAAYYQKVIEVFAEGIKRGMASVPLEGKMVDVPVDVRAKLYLRWANRASARDADKAQARAQAAAR